MEFEYSQDKMAIEIKKKVESLRKSKTLFSVLSVICYLIYMFYIIMKMIFCNYIIKGDESFWIPSIIMFLIVVILNFKVELSIYTLLIKVINLNYPEGLLNLSIYNYKSFNKIYPKRKYLITQLSNIATAYYQMGDVDNAMKVVIYIENQYNNINNKKVENLKNLIISNIKSAIAQENNDIEELEKQSIKLKEIFGSFPEYIRKNGLIKINLRKAIIENNIDEVNKLCDELDKSKSLPDRVSSAYVRAQILEKNEKEGWKDYYKYVAKNGNTLSIAKKSREKLDIKDFEIINIKFKRHFGNELLITLIIFSIISICFLFIDYKYEKSKISWDIGEVAILNNKIALPCTISDFEKKLGVKIDISKISNLGYYELHLNELSLQYRSNTWIDRYKKINLIISDGYIIGIELNIFDSLNNQLDRELGEMITFPKEITVNSELEKLKNTYRTGLLNLFAQDMNVKIEKYNRILYSYGIVYKGNNYCVDIKAINGVVTSILYYYDN